MSRAYTKKEARKKFLDGIHEIVDYWVNEARDRTVEGKINGAVFSILAMIDGSNIDIPAFDIAINSHPDDKEFYKKEGSNWFEDGMIINDDCHLHEFWHNGESQEDNNKVKEEKND